MQNENAVLEYEFLSMYSDINDKLEMTNVALIRYLQEMGGLQTKKIFGGMLTPKGVWILLNWRIKRFKEIPWGKTFKIKTWPAISTKLYSIRNYEVYNDKGELVAIASTKWVLMDINTKKLVKDITDVINKYDSDDKMLFEDDFPKLKVPENIEYSYKHIVQRRDIDTNGHVNNTKYLELAYEALPETVYDSCNFKNIDIQYKHSAFLNEDMIIGYDTKIVDNKDEYVVVVKSKANDKDAKNNKLLRTTKIENQDNNLDYKINAIIKLS